MIHVLASVIEPHKLTGNLGDVFGYVLMEFYCKKMNIEVKRVGIKDDIGKNTFAIVGSIYHLCIRKLQEAQWKMNKKYGKEINISNNIIIIGCGKIERGGIIGRHKNLICLGVRGPETQKLIRYDAPVISDPGLLISRLFSLKKVSEKKDIGYIIHGVDREFFFKLFPEKKQDLIDNYSTYEDFLNQLSKYKTVISSSLHGIIFCHSYGIPVCSIRITDKISGNNFKYIDYYHSIGNKNFKGRHQVTKDTNFKNLIKNEWQPDKENIENIKNIQENIIINSIKKYI